MIDGVKITTNFYNKEHFLNNPLLQFNQRLNLNTGAVSYTHLRAHETVLDLVCRLLLEKTKTNALTISVSNKQYTNTNTSK